MRYQIKHRVTGVVLFEADLPGGMATRHALEQAVEAGANLGGADLYGADLRGANLGGASLYGANLGGADLYGANLGGADLYGADLRGASLYGASLYGANLGGASLYGADLYGANLRGADLGSANLGEGKKLIAKRPILIIGPIGSRSDNLMAFITEAGILLKAGCFFGTAEEFQASLADKHGDNDHAREYAAALAMIQAHAEIWTPKQSEAPDVAA
jgi:hypothetical protein